MKTPVKRCEGECTEWTRIQHFLIKILRQMPKDQKILIVLTKFHENRLRIDRVISEKPVKSHVNPAYVER